MSKKQKAPSLKLHCNIDEKAFSKALFVCRILVGSALIYWALGALLYWRDFAANAASLDFPFAQPLAIGLAMAELLIGLFLMLGWYTRFWAGIELIVSGLCMVVFFAGTIDKILIVMCLLLAACMSVLMWLGPGVLSLDYKRSQYAFSQIFRG